MTVEERILLWFARDSTEPEIGATMHYTLDNCLDFPLKTVPDLLERIRRKRMLDFGCGFGWQAVALKRLGAEEIWGVDIVDEHLERACNLARENQVSVKFTRSVPRNESFDVVLSISAFEHFSDPEDILRLMKSHLRSDGQLIITWAEPWYSHSGSHIGNFTKIPGKNRAIPWCNLFFSDRALLALRSRFRTDHPERIEDIEGGLNKMTIARFERIMRDSGMRIERFEIHPTLGLPMVSRIPIVREFLSSAATCILHS